MENKYYTPNIEDLRVGYEYEFLEKQKDGSEKWIPRKIIRRYDLEDDWESWLHYNIIRTPYLTKEQAEAEKWENIEDLDDDGAFSATKTISGIIYKLTWTSDKSMQIWDTNFQHCVYFGSCPSINEFRFICKLLNI